MIRAMSVIVIAVMCAALFGVDRSVLAAQKDPTPQQKVASRVARLKVGDVVTGKRTDGKKFKGVVVSKTTDSITVDVYRPRTFRRDQRLGQETMTFDSLREIKKETTWQDVAIGSALVVGVCTAAVGIAAASLDEKSVEGVEEERPGGQPR